MLPNWLYGKSKSKLASILGGGGGAPADYNQVKAQVAQNKLDIEQNTEDIGLLSDALDAKAALTQITNPNLLINPWFTVNQRGFTTGSISPNPYVADRWKVIGTVDIIATNDANGITIETNANDDAILETTIAPNVSKSLLGRELTMSLSRIIGRVDSSRTFTMPDSFPESSTSYYTETTEDYSLTAVVGSDGHVKIRVQVKEDKVVTIRAIKLEIGNISTLARDSRPDMTTELLKCQRYFVRIKNASATTYKALLGIGQGRSAPTTTNIALAISLPIAMRINPSITFSTDGISYSATTSTAGEGENATACSGLSNAGYIRGVIVSGANITPGNSYMVFLNPNSYIDFSAEL